MSKIQILKAIHNHPETLRRTELLFMMSKIQILKAIHNTHNHPRGWGYAVYDVKDTNFESNSQHIKYDITAIKAVYDVKDTNFESNSQHLTDCLLDGVGCL